MARSKQLKLSPIQLKAITILLSGQTKRRTCDELDIGESTLMAWLRDPLFREELEKRQNEVFEEACGRLKVTICRSIDVMSALLSSEDEAIQFKAAGKIIDSALRVKEILDIEPRLRALEESTK